MLHDMRPCKGYSITEYLHPDALFREGFARPARVLRAMDICLWVWHEAEDTSTRITDSGDVMHRTIGIPGVGSRRAIRFAVTRRNLLIGLEGVQHRGILRYEFAFPVPCGEVTLF